MNDNKIREVLNKEIKVPYNFSKTIETSLYKKDNSKFKISKVKKIAIISLLVLIFAGVTFATIYSKFDLNIFGDSNLGINKAIKNNYIYNINSNFIYSNNVGIKIKSVIMDNSTLNILFEYELKGKFFDVNNIYISDLLIKDEKGNIIYSSDNSQSMVAKNIDFYRINKISKTNVEQGLILTCNNNFPLSEQLYISFSKIEISNSLFKKALNVNFNTEIKLPVEFSNRKIVNFSQSTKNEEFNVIKSELSSTSLYVEIETELLNSYEIKYITLKDNVILLDQNNNKYYIGRNLELEEKNGKNIYKFYFENITKYDNINELFIEYNLQNKSSRIKLIKQ